MPKINLFKKFWGKRYRIIEVDKGLKDNEILIFGHKIFIKRRNKK